MFRDMPTVHPSDVDGAVAQTDQHANLDESFDTWTGDQMHECNDLVYKLTVTNTSDQPVEYKVNFTEEAGSAGTVNLRWPINGIKGKIAGNESQTIALL